MEKCIYRGTESYKINGVFLPDSLLDDKKYRVFLPTMVNGVFLQPLTIPTYGMSLTYTYLPNGYTGDCFLGVAIDTEGNQIDDNDFRFFFTDGYSDYFDYGSNRTQASTSMYTSAKQTVKISYEGCDVYDIEGVTNTFHFDGSTPPSTATSYGAPIVAAWNLNNGMYFYEATLKDETTGNIIRHWIVKPEGIYDTVSSTLTPIQSGWVVEEIE